MVLHVARRSNPSSGMDRNNKAHKFFHLWLQRSLTLGRMSYHIWLTGIFSTSSAKTPFSQEESHYHISQGVGLSQVDLDGRGLVS